MSPYYGTSPYYGGGPGGFYNGPVEVTRDVPEKPPTARPQALVSEQQIVIQEVLRLRPNWQVLSTAGISGISGPVDLVRVIIGDTDTIESDRTAKSLWCGLGLGVPGFFMMVHETQRIQGGIARYQSDADTLRPHLIRYPQQPDFAVDTRGLTPSRQTFGLDVSYEEGLFGAEAKRDQVIVRSFAERLAVAIVAVVEGIRPEGVKPP
jgi:hypothetical protein